MLLLAHDITDPKFVEEVYHYKSGVDVKKIPMTLAERVETVIWDISFLNNFYGAYFVNRIALAEDYLEEVEKLKKNIRRLDVGEGFFRRIGIYPDKTLWAFKNIHNAYPALEILGQKTFGPEKRSYGRPVQALLSALRLSSSEESQDFSAFQKPDKNLVDGHAAVLLPLLAKNNVITKFSLFLRQNFSEEFGGRLGNEEFKRFQRKYHELDFKSLRPSIARLVSAPNFWKAAEGAISALSEMGEREANLAATEFLISIKHLVSLPGRDLKALLEIAAGILQSSDASELVNAFQKLEPAKALKAFNKLLGIFSSSPGLLEKLKPVLADPDLLRENLGQMTEALLYESDFFGSIILDQRFSTKGLIANLSRIKSRHGGYAPLFQSIELLKAKRGSVSGLEKALRAIMIQSDEEFISFIEEIFLKFELKPNTLSQSSE